MEKRTAVSYRNINITGGFWKDRQALNRNTTIYAVEDRFADTGRFEAFNFDYTPGSDKPKPHFFWDSDIAKWLESAAYILAKTPDKRLQARVDEVVENVQKHQDPNGYFNIYHTVVEPENRFRLMDHHELYCLGHLLEAAVALKEAVGDTRLLDCMSRYVDYVARVFVEEKSAAFKVPGHEEIELALYRAYRCTGDEKYRRLADHFINARGYDARSIGGWCLDNYCQNHMPVREQTEAMGHCVRACYLYAGMADAARYMDDPEMLDACRALFDDITLRKMYITGGIGSTHCGEAFTVPYDLPNDTAYTETCAAIALAMFANRMKDLELDAKYADTAELAMYNGILSGISLDGVGFFYENPLELNLSDRTRHTTVRDPGERLPITRRKEVFDCSCCPPNVTRFIASIGDYAYSADGDAVYVHQYFESEAVFDGVTLKADTAYPADGRVVLTLKGAKGKTLYARVPGWCRRFDADKPCCIKNGYAAFTVGQDDETFTLQFDMPVVTVCADPRVRANAGKVAVMRGPVVYCLEALDVSAPLADIRLPHDAAFSLKAGEFGLPSITTEAVCTREFSVKSLYMPLSDVKAATVPVTLIPYYAFANRAECDMRVWIGKC